nr:hypothetical protein [Luteococcus japonicus]
MVQFGAAADGDVDVPVEDELGHLLGMFGGAVQRAFEGVVVTDADRVVADAEGRHQVVEEAVVVVRTEGDHQGGVEVLDEGAGLVEGDLDVGADVCG